jgi:hypothetical protein
MKSTPRTRFLAVASLAIGAASFAFAADTPPSGDRPSASDTRSNVTGSSATDRQDRTSDLSRNSSATDRNGSNTGSSANAPDAQAMSQLLGKTVDAALNGDVRQVAQNFYQADQKRFDQGRDQAQQQNQQLQQASADLKKSFQEKYHQDLSLADASKIFGSDFVRPGNEIGEGARPAGARIGGSQSDTNLNSRSSNGTSGSQSNTGTSGTSGTSGNTGSQSNTGSSGTSGNSSSSSSNTGSSGTSGTSGSQANTGNSNTGISSTGNQSNTSSANSDTSSSKTGSTSGDRSSSSGARTAASGLGDSTSASTGLTPQAQSMTVPASHGLPAVSLSVIKEGSDWKLNVPDTLTPQKLQQNLARELARCNDQKAQWPQDAQDAQKALAHHVLLAIMDQDSSRQTGAGAADTDTHSRTGGDIGTGSSTDRNRPGSSGAGNTGSTGR